MGKIRESPVSASVTPAQRHSRGRPCRICKGHDQDPRGQERRCNGFDSDDGTYVRCSREEFAGNLSAESSPAGDLYRHCMVGKCHCGVQHGQDFRSNRPDHKSWDYLDAAGKLAYQVTRWPDRKVTQRRPDGGGGWVANLKGVSRILYRLPEVLASTGPLYLVEGERDADTLWSRGLPATTSSQGAASWALTAENARPHLTGRDVTILGDADKAGRGYARAVEVTCRQVCKSVTGPLECTLGKDITDHLANGGTLEDLVPIGDPRSWYETHDGATATPATAAKPRLATVDGKRVEPPAWDDHEPADPDETKRPAVMMGHRVDLVIDSLERHMATLDSNLYKRAHELVTVLPADKIKGVSDGTPVIHPLGISAMLGRVTRHVQFLIPQDDDPPKKIPPPDRILKAFCASPPWPNVRYIVSITESPVFRPNGTIRQDQGYDADTGYLFQPACEYPRVPEHPSQAEAKSSLATLIDVFADFPYVNEASRLVAISAILSMIGRGAIAGPVPGHLFDASVMGSGKTLQCDVVHLIATGRIAAHASWPVKDEDQEKLLNTYANAALPGIVLDNVKGVFGGATIEQTLTSEMVQFRQLGGLGLRTLPWRSVVMVSGNNVALTDDMIRRMLMCRLESSLADPTQRSDFAHPELLDWVRAERPRLVVAALTMLRAYAAKGWPDTGVKLASYQAWARVVAGSIRFAGGADVTTAQPPRERAALDDSGAVATLIERLGSLADVPRSLASILQAVYPAPGRNDPPDGYNDVREALESLAPAKGPMGPSSRSVGRKLSKFNGRWFGNRRLVARVDEHSKVMLWVVEAR